MHIGTLTAGEQFEVELRVSSTSTAPVAYAIFWTAPASASVPDPIVGVAVPGASVRETGTVPVGAQRLNVDLDLPDEGGGASMRVTAGAGLNFSRDTITADARWTAVVA